MKLILKEVKPWDFIIFSALILLSFVPLFAFSVQKINEPEITGKIAIVKIDSEEVDRFDIDSIDHLKKTYYPGKGKYNIVEIKKGKIRVKEDNSPDQIAVRTGWISKNGQSSICLPHKLVIEIISGESDENKGYPIY
ncbi:NusG domain II-containing protein [Enterococcus gilvus]|uniref:NusG domain II-containing protein n=1 Tax=Enterococcus gilvus TaxID=160453 RepID=UPI00290C9226|nr:NusG domain II-containing protein [Enterococcus gilvus]MDU5511630.1 NusG domain II-containing protein [Enterococcus gilvus]